MGAGERIVANPGHSIGNSNRGQATAMIERIIADRVYALRESYHFKSTAIVERIIADACYGGNYNSLEIMLLPYL